MGLLERKEKLNELFSFYGALLTSKQCEYFRMYYYEDLSLKEIASLNKVTRNAVYTQLQKIEKKLEFYEEVLKMGSNSKERAMLLDKIRKLDE